MALQRGKMRRQLQEIRPRVNVVCGGCGARREHLMLSGPACRVNRSAINGRDAITRVTPEWAGWYV